MAEMDLVFGCVARELEFAVGCGRAAEFGRAIGEAIAEQLATAREPSLDQLAALAMPGMLADEDGGEGGVYQPEKLAKRAYDFAEAMQAEGKRRSGSRPADPSSKLDQS